MSVTLTQVLIQQGYLTVDQYHHAYQVQQSQTIDARQPLSQIYLEQGFFGIEHLDYCLKLRQQYISEGYDPETEYDTGSYEAQPASAVYEEQSQSIESSKENATGTMNCKVCLSECQASWSMCPFCGSSL